MSPIPPILNVINYEEFKKEQSFRILPSRRGCYKKTDAEQMRFFMERQKNLDFLWRQMGVVSIETVKFPEK
jgi:hypothetical protein